MPFVGAQFDPAQAPSVPASLDLQSQSDQQNWMTQAAQRQQMGANTQLTQAQTAQLQMLAPVVAAKAAADTVVAQNSLLAATKAQELRAQAGSQYTVAQQEFNDANQLADYNDKATAMSSLAAKWGWLADVGDPQAKAVATQIENARVTSHQEAMTDMQMQMQLDRMQMLTGSRVDVAQIGAGAREDVAQIGAGARTDAAQIGANARTGAATITANSRNPSTQLDQFSQAADQLTDMAMNAPPDQAAEMLRRAQLLRTRAQTMANPKDDFMLNQPGSGAAPGAPGAGGAQPTAGTGQPYQIDPKTGTFAFTQPGMAPKAKLAAIQQAVNNGDLTQQQALSVLQKLGFKLKRQKPSSGASAEDAGGPSISVPQAPSDLAPTGT